MAFEVTSGNNYLCSLPKASKLCIVHTFQEVCAKHSSIIPSACSIHHLRLQPCLHVLYSFFCICHNRNRNIDKRIKGNNFHQKWSYCSLTPSKIALGKSFQEKPLNTVAKYQFINLGSPATDSFTPKGTDSKAKRKPECSHELRTTAFSSGFSSAPFYS